MIRSLFKLGLMAVVCIVIYNYFFGSNTEKEQSKKIFQGVGNVFTEVRGLVSSEKDKFDGGKYDSALGKMQDVIGRLRTHASATNDPALEKQVAQLEQRKKDLQQKVDATQANGNAGFQKAADKAKEYSAMAQQMEALTNDIQRLVNTKAAPSEQ